MSYIKSLSSFVISATLLASLASPVLADSISTNFESPYISGSINSQYGWSSLGSVGLGCAVYDHAISTQSLFPSFGSQSLRISNAIVSGCFGDQTFASPLTNSVGEIDSTNGSYTPGSKQRHFEMKFDIASAVPDAEQPGLYLSVSPDRGDGSRMSYLRFEDSTNGINVFFDDASFTDIQVGTNLNRAIPHTVKLTFDPVDGPSNDVVKVWIDGVLVQTGTSWEDYYRFDPEAAAEQSSRIVKTVLFRTGGSENLPSVSGKGFLIDNLSYSSGPVLIDPPTNKSQCKNNGWKKFNNPSFRNQGQCVEFVEHLTDDKDKHENRSDDHKNEDDHSQKTNHREHQRED